MPPDPLTWQALTRLAWIGDSAVVVREASCWVPRPISKRRDPRVGSYSDLRAQPSRGIACTRSGNAACNRAADESHLERFASSCVAREDVAHGRAEPSDASKVVLGVLVQFITSVGERAHADRHSARNANCGQASDGVGSAPSDERARPKPSAKGRNLRPERIPLGRWCSRNLSIPGGFSDASFSCFRANRTIKVIRRTRRLGGADESTRRGTTCRT